MLVMTPMWGLTIMAKETLVSKVTKLWCGPRNGVVLLGAHPTTSEGSTLTDFSTKPYLLI